MLYLIGYDISESKRLQKIYKRLTKYATPIQYSIFLLDGSPENLKNCLDTLLPILDKKKTICGFIRCRQRLTNGNSVNHFCPKGLFGLED